MWIPLVSGLFIGFLIGMLAMALAIAADDNEERQRKPPEYGRGSSR